MHYQPPEDMKHFLASGKRPVYVGFGSMTLSKAKVISHQMQVTLWCYRYCQDSCNTLYQKLAFCLYEHWS